MFPGELRTVFYMLSLSDNRYCIMVSGISYRFIILPAIPVIKNSNAIPALNNLAGPFKNKIPPIKMMQPMMVKNCGLLVFIMCCYNNIFREIIFFAVRYCNFSLKKSTVRCQASSAAVLSYLGVVSL